MDIFDQILENLELERELGTRTIEIDRALLAPPKPAAESEIAQKPTPVHVSGDAPRSAVPVVTERPVAPPVRPAEVKASPVARPSTPATAVSCDIVFFTGRPLSAAGTEAMEKIFAAIGKIKAGVTIGLNGEKRAKVCVLLGSDALLKRVPTARPMRGAWTMVDGVPAIMTFSPDYIFSHFQEGSPRMKDAKLVMWNDIKAAVARLK